MTPLHRLCIALGIACALPALAVAVAQGAKVVAQDKAVTPAEAPKSSKESYEKLKGGEQKAADKAVDKKAEYRKAVVGEVEGKTTIVELKPDLAQKKADAKPAEKKELTAAEKKRAEYRKAVNGEDEGEAGAKRQVVQGRAVMKAVRLAPARDAMVAAPAQPDNEPMIAQYLPQFIPMMRTEVHLLLTTTEATPEERRAIVADRQKATREAAKQYAASQNRQGRFMNTSTYPEPRKLAQESLIATAKVHLSPEKLAKYQAEIDRRADDQKGLAIENLVAKMDSDLVLSDEQRDKIAASLAKNWNASWCQSLETFMYGDQYFPAIPDNVIVPSLNAKQAQVWRSTPKNGGVIFGGFNNVFGGMDTDDAFPKDEEPEEKDKEKINAGAANAMPAQVIVREEIVVETKEVKKVEDKAKTKEVKEDDAKGRTKDVPKDRPKAEAKDGRKDAPKDAPHDVPREDAPKTTTTTTTKTKP